MAEGGSAHLHRAVREIVGKRALLGRSGSPVASLAAAHFRSADARGGRDLRPPEDHGRRPRGGRVRVDPDDGALLRPGRRHQPARRDGDVSPGQTGDDMHATRETKDYKRATPDAVGKTSVRNNALICSQAPLGAPVTCPGAIKNTSYVTAPGGTRTHDIRIRNAVGDGVCSPQSRSWLC